jgi:hypothetical protein
MQEICVTSNLQALTPKLQKDTLDASLLANLILSALCTLYLKLNQLVKF